MSSGGSWLQFGNSANKFKSSYVRGFLDVCGNIQVRQGGLTMSHGDISCNGDVYINRIRDHDGNLIVSSSGSGTIIDDTTNLTINSLTEVKSTSRLTGNVGIGKPSTNNALDVSGNTNTSGNIIVNGTSELLGTNASVGKVIDTNYNLDVNGTIRTSDSLYIKGSTIIASDASTTTDTSGAVLYLKDTRTDVSHNIIMDTPNAVFKSIVNGNLNRTAHLEIDTTNRRILPFVKDANGDNVDVSGSVSDGWKLGGPGPNRFDEIYARDVKISTNTLLIEDDAGNKIGMSFDAATGAVNYNVTTKDGEQFTIKGVQTQKISSGSGSIDPSLLEFTGLSFGDTFDCSVTRDLANVVTYNLDTTTYSVDFLTSSAGTQTLGDFIGNGASNATALLGTIDTNDSVTIKVNNDDRLDADRLDGIDISGSFIDLTGKVISVQNKAGTLKWKLWGDMNELNNNTVGNFLNYIELKNINMASGTYFVAKTSGNIVYNNNNQDYLTNDDLIGVVNGDLFLYIDRSPGNNWTKIPVSLPASSSITTQMLADQSVTSSKIGINSVINSKLADNSVTTNKIADLSITADKIQVGAISGSAFADNSISGVKIATGSIPLDRLAGDALSGKQDTLVAGSNITINNITKEISASVDASIPTSSITNDKMAINSINTNNIVSGSVTGAKIADNTITILNMTTDSVGTTNIENNAITSAKITDGNITSVKLATASVIAGKIAVGAINISDIIANGVVTSSKLALNAVVTDRVNDGSITSAKLDKDAVDSYITAGANVTLTKDIGTGIVTIASSGGGGGGGTLADSAVTSVKIADSAVTTVKIADSAVTSAKIADSAVTSAKLDKNVVDSFITAGANVTLSKDAGTGVVTIASSGGGGGGGASVGTDSELVINDLEVNKTTTFDNTLITGTNANDKFGFHATINKDGDVAIMGDSNNNIYVYRLNNTTKVWELETTLSGSKYMAISGNGNIIITSSGSTNSTKFTYDGSSWDAGTTLNYPAKHITIDYTGEIIVFCHDSNPPIKIYRTSDQSVVEQGGSSGVAPYNGYYFRINFNNSNNTGWSCQVSKDGNTLIASLYSAVINPAIGIHENEPENPTGTHYYWSGSYGLVSIWKYVGGVWVRDNLIGERWGRKATINADGTKLAFSVGLSSTGRYSMDQSILVYDYDGSSWSLEQEIKRDNDIKTWYFGEQLKLSDDGNVLLVGCFHDKNGITADTYLDPTYFETIGYSKQALMYKKTNNNWEKTNTFITNVHRENLSMEASNFGESIGLSSDGNRVIIGEDNYYSEDADSLGRVHLFDIDNIESIKSNGGLMISSDLNVKNNAIVNGIVQSDKLYSNNISIGDSMTIGGPEIYGPLMNDGLTSNNTGDKRNYSFYVRNSDLGRSKQHNSGAYIESKSRFDGNIFSYGSINGSGINNGDSQRGLQLLGNGNIISIDEITCNKITANEFYNPAGGDTISENVTATSRMIAGKQLISNNLVGPSALSSPTLISTIDYSSGYIGKWANMFDELISMSSDGNRIMSASRYGVGQVGKIYVWDRDTVNNTWNSVPTHTVDITYNAYISTYSGDGNTLASVNGGTGSTTEITIHRYSGGVWSDQALKLTDQSGKSYGGNFVRNFKLNEDGSKILVASYTSASLCGFYVYDTVTASMLIEIDCANTVNFQSYGGYFAGCDFSADASTIATGNGSTSVSTAKIYTWDIDYVASTATESIISMVAPSGTTGSETPGRVITINHNGTVLAYSSGIGADNMRVDIQRRASKSDAWTLDKQFVGADVVSSTNRSIDIGGIQPGKLRLSKDGSTIFITQNQGRNYTTDSYVSVSKYVDGKWQHFHNIKGATNSDFGFGIGSDWYGNRFTIACGANNGYPSFVYDIPANSSESLNIMSNEINIKTGPSLTNAIHIDISGNIGMGIDAISGTKLNVDGTINATGSITGNSDDRLKENEELILEATNTLMKLRPEIYDKKPSMDNNDATSWQRESGVIAQEVWYSAPELRHLVSLGSKQDGYKYITKTVSIEKEEIIETYDLSGNHYDTSGNVVNSLGEIINNIIRVDHSGNLIDSVGTIIQHNFVDSSGNITNEINTMPTQGVIIDNNRNIKLRINYKNKHIFEVVQQPILVQIKSTDIQDPDTNTNDLNNDPDYSSLGWGNTPAAVNYIGMIPYIIKSNQEQQLLIDDLKSQLLSKTQQITTIEQRLSMLENP